MNSRTLLFLAIFLGGMLSAQPLKEYRFGVPFNISYPTNYIKVYDLNDVAAAQFSNVVNDKYSVVIQAERENLTFYQVTFSDIKEAAEFYSKNITAGLVDDITLKKTLPKQMVINNNQASETTIEGKFLDEESKTSTMLFYHITIVETAGYYYQIISWCNLKDKDKNVEEFRKIAKSFKEIT